MYYAFRVLGEMLDVYLVFWWWFHLLWLWGAFRTQWRTLDPGVEPLPGLFSARQPKHYARRRGEAVWGEVGLMGLGGVGWVGWGELRWPEPSPNTGLASESCREKGRGLLVIEAGLPPLLPCPLPSQPRLKVGQLTAPHPAVLGMQRNVISLLGIL